MPQWGVVAVLLSLPGTLCLGSDWSGRIRVQLGEEYDTNVHRVYAQPSGSETQDEEHQVHPDGLSRLILNGSIGYAGSPHRLSLTYSGGAKLFHHQTSEHFLANQLDGMYSYAFSKSFALGSRANFQDTTLAKHLRDYRLIQGELFERLILLRFLQVEVFQGARDYFFKPDQNGEAEYLQKHSYWSPHFGVRFMASIARGLSASLTYQAEVRLYSQDALYQDSNRRDIHHEVSLKIQYEFPYWQQRHLLFELSPLFAYNDSNSRGSSILWQRIRLVAAIQLPLDLTLQLMGTLQFTSYPDGLFTDNQNYEPNADENENSFAGRLSYRFWDKLSVMLDAAFYQNDFRSGEGLPVFRRETIMLGIAYDLPL
jgi:hypothetical protein